MRGRFDGGISGGCCFVNIKALTRLTHNLIQKRMMCRSGTGIKNTFAYLINVSSGSFSFGLPRISFYQLDKKPSLKLFVNYKPQDKM